MNGTVAQQGMPWQVMLKMFGHTDVKLIMKVYYKQHDDQRMVEQASKIDLGLPPSPQLCAGGDWPCMSTCGATTSIDLCDQDWLAVRTTRIPDDDQPPESVGLGLMGWTLRRW